MEVKRLDLKYCLTTTEFDPSPHRLYPEETPVSQRTLPLYYTCENCNNSIFFKPENFKKHYKSDFTNLQLQDKKHINNFIENKSPEFIEKSFIDFYCDNCKQATTIIYDGDSFGYGGVFEFKIISVLVIKSAH